MKKFYYLKLQNKIMTSIMTKYEKARVLGTRAKQISMNAPTIINDNKLTNVIDIAEKELEKGVIPFIICRYLPNGCITKWNIEKNYKLKLIK